MKYLPDVGISVTDLYCAIGPGVRTLFDRASMPPRVSPWDSEWTARGFLSHDATQAGMDQ